MRTDGGTLLTLTHEQFFDEDARDRHQPRDIEDRQQHWKRVDRSRRKTRNQGSEG